MNHHFISYSKADGRDLAVTLRDALERGEPRFQVWIDDRDLRPGEDYDTQIAEAIRTAESLIFIVTRDSVEDQSECKWEWVQALTYKKHIIPVLLQTDAELPPRLRSLQYIDASESSDPAIARLRGKLLWLKTPEGVLQAMKDRFADAVRALRRTEDANRRMRIEDDMAVLTRQIEEQERILAYPEDAALRVEQNIAQEMERERRSERPRSGTPPAARFVNPPPGAAPSWFQDRHIETRLLGDFLKDDSVRLITVAGRAGVGKTAMVCRLLKSVETGRLPDDGEPLPVDGILYLSAAGTRRLRLINIYSDLTRLLPSDSADRLNALYTDPRLGAGARMQAILAEFPRGRTILLLDNFEDVIDPITMQIHDSELDEALRALLDAPQHGVRVILTTRIAPRHLALVQPGRQRRLDLDEGLISPYAENILREMDADGRLGLRTASRELLNEARERTRGYPRALEALFAILSADRDTSIEDILSDAAHTLPENVVRDLVGEAFSRLDSGAQQVMQALAVYGRPVPAAAVDYLLQPYVPGVNAAPVLNRLLNAQFVRRESRRYYLHEVDRAYSLDRIPRGSARDRLVREHPSFTQFALLNRAARYFRETRTPPAGWTTIDDLAAQLAEFDLHCAGEDYNAAALVLSSVDYDYLYLWGHYQLMVDLHRRLQGKITEPELRQNCAGNLGTAYYSMGQYGQAMVWYQQALDLARSRKDRSGEGTWLANVGLAWTGLGQTRKAIECYEQSILIARKVGNRGGEGLELGTLGTCYGDLGETAKAIECCEKALASARATRFRRAEGFHLDALSELLIDECRYQEAAHFAVESAAIGAELRSRELGSFANYHLALARLFAGDLSPARAAAEEAQRFDEPRNNVRVLAVIGIIALLDADPLKARESFETAVAEAEGRLTRERDDHLALAGKALSLGGLAMSGVETDLDAIEDTWRAARAINREAGIVGREIRLLEALAPADRTGILERMCAAASAD